MAEVNLTQEIENESGYIDNVVAEIKSIEARDELVMTITCVGGDVFQGDRLNRAILEHNGPTKAIVIGLAASMGGVILSAFDEVELDEDANVMLHKAHIPELALEDYTPEQTQMCQNFNDRAFSRLTKRGVDKELLDKIFISDEVKDFWFSAAEAAAIGMGTVSRIERRDGQPFKVAAKLDINSIKNSYKEMGLFKNKAVAQMITAKDGRKFIFNSESEVVAKGDLLQLVGSNENLQGKIMLSDTMEATLDEKNEVTDLTEVEAENGMEARMSAIESALKAITAQFGEDDEEEEKAKAEAKTEAEAVAKSDDKEKEEMKAVLAQAVAALKGVHSDFKLKKADDKGETIVSHLSENEIHARGLIEVTNNLKIKK